MMEMRGFAACISGQGGIGEGTPSGCEGCATEDGRRCKSEHYRGKDDVKGRECNRFYEVGRGVITVN